MSATITDLHSLRRTRASGAPSVPSGGRVADHLRAGLVRVPGWFTVAQVRQVGELKGADHLLVEESGGRSATVALSSLAVAPGGDLVARWSTPADAPIDAGASLDEARRLLRAERAACLPVVSGGVLVGTISLPDLAMADDLTSHAA